MKNHLSTYAALTLTMLVWGLSFIGTKIALGSFTPFVCIFLRFSLASLFFLLVFIVQGFPKLSLEQHRKLILTALFQPGLYFAFETIGLTYTTASTASIILALVPIAVLILAHLILKEAISGYNVAGILLSVLGIILLVWGGSFNWSWQGYLLGNLLILGAVFSAAFYMVMARDLGKSLSSLQITGFQVLYGTLIFAPFFFYYLPQVQWAQVSLHSYGAIVFLSLFCTIGGFLAYNYALTRIEASRASVFINGVPVVTAVGAWFILNEKLTLLQMGGGALVLLAVFISNIPAQSKAYSAQEQLP
ncbi:MAG: DMT family transporter [Syntrophomonadaceae bacterium]|jgi:drug/metabolite transporter (DMT)-like permease|nr:DMT family transporter [Syntrophomonadaceae bacterium]